MDENSKIRPLYDRAYELLLLKRVGKNIRDFREKHNVTQRELAKLAGLQASYVNDIEKGRRNLSFRSFLKICIALDARPESLLIGTDRDSLSRSRIQENS
ncbi:hypothetical protein EOPP23_14785 [Endozoicomonas sp. OPT23]|uniref:helix-turn-helix domain-containing protein n=1 Tax=Endozoicomonas sp. OPT23 TaxID=2072845 RepID=UPI00129BA025|nr:hypothetical protein [Endozoicomonas sp. OPT23]